MSGSDGSAAIKPAPGRRPLVGHLPALIGDKLAFFASCRDPAGAAVRCDLGRSALLLNDPADIGHVLVENHRNYDKSRRLTGRRGRRLNGRGLLTSAGKEARRRRRALQPAFRHEVVEALVAGAPRNAERFTAGWRAGQELDVAAEMMALAQRNLIVALFGPLPEAALADVAAALTARRRLIDRVFETPVPPELVPSRLNLDYRLAMRRLDRFMRDQVGARRADGRNSTDESNPDLLSMLVAGGHEDGTPLSDESIRDEALTLSKTGYETVGEALAWTWYLLSREPEAERRFETELDDALGGSPPGPADLDRLPYTGRIVQESLRLYPPTWIYVRVAREADRLPSGAPVRSGQKLYLCPWAVHRNPALFPDPERFDPDRFTEQAVAGRPRYAYFPFGKGPRVCIGESFATAELALVLATVGQRFRLRLVPGQEIVPEPRVTLRPRDGIRMRVEPRD